MLKTIFRKLIVIFVSILIFSFSVTGVILYFSLGNFVTQDKVDRLKESADQISAYLSICMPSIADPDVQSNFYYNLRAISNLSHSNIWIVYTNGSIIFSSPKLDRGITGKLQYSSGTYRLPDKKQYEEIMSGKKEYIEEQGDFYGLFENTGSPWLTIEKPFKILDNDGKELVTAAIYLHTRIPEINKARSALFGLFMFSMLISVLLAIVLVYIFSSRITKPLKEIKNASRVIANGDFQKRLNIRSKDEIGELANSFNQMANALESNEEMRRGFIANVSHELRTPMTSIRGFIEGILDGTIPPEKQNNYLVIVRDEINRLNRLANDILTLARLESGEVKLSMKEFNINELIRRSVIKLEGMIMEKGLHVQADFDEEDLYVKADPDAIERVVINLIHNAIKFTGVGGKINVTTLKKKDKIYVSIQDNGTGIEKHEIDKIWERFYKSDKSRGMDKAGTGLGLSIVRNIILEHKQDIYVESEAGKGAKFTFSLENSRVSGI